MMMPLWHHHSPVSPTEDDYHLHVMLVLLDRDWGVKADPQTKNFSHQSPVWGSSSTSGVKRPNPPTNRTLLSGLSQLSATD